MNPNTVLDISMLANYGVLGLFALVTLGALWKITTFLGDKFFNDERGYVPRYLASHQKFMDGLSERDAMQQELCGKHVLTLGMVESVVSGNAEKNAVTVAGLDQIKTAGREHCKMCRALVREHLPSSVPAIETHLNKIEELLK